MGKTALQNSIALNAAKRWDKRVAMFNLEMSGEQLVQRMIAAETRIDSQRLRRGDLGDHEWAIFLEALGRLSESRIFIDDTPSITPMQLRTKCRRLHAEHGLDMVMIDYLQLMQAEHPTSNRVQEVSEISRELKGLARELDVPVVAAAQLSRAVEQRQNKRPLLSDLRDSGCLTGDTLISLADSGERVPMRDLVGRSGFSVWALNPTTYQIERAVVSHAFSSGIKQTYRLTTRLGRTIRATGNHLFLTIGGWQRLDELAAGVHIALPRQLATSNMPRTLNDTELALLGHLIGDGCIRMTWGKSPRPAIYYATSSKRLAHDVQSLLLRVGINGRFKCTSQGERGRPQYHVIVSGRGDVLRFAERIGAVNSARRERLTEIVCYLENREENTNRDVIPQSVWDLHVRPAMQAAGVTHRALYAEVGAAYSGMAMLKQNLSRERAERVAQAARSSELQTLAESDVYWDQIASIEPDGIEEVFDLTVPGPHNFIADDIIVHNSIEQDADVVMFIYRDDYYNQDNSERPNVAEVNVAKHRNGPTGAIDLYWHGQLATFRNLHRQEVEL
jgi:replicative DNA helicase